MSVTIFSSLTIEKISFDCRGYAKQTSMTKTGVLKLTTFAEQTNVFCTRFFTHLKDDIL
jgi:hypothetical protein